MYGSLWIDVANNYGILCLAYQRRRNLAGDYAAEEAVAGTSITGQQAVAPRQPRVFVVSLPAGADQVSAGAYVC